MGQIEGIVSSSPSLGEGDGEGKGDSFIITFGEAGRRRGARRERGRGKQRKGDCFIITFGEAGRRRGARRGRGKERRGKEWQEKWEAVWKKPWHDALQMAWSEVEEVPPREEIFLPLGKRIDIEDVSMVEDRNERARRLWIRCEECGTILYRKHVKENAKVCFTCASHIEMSSKERIESLIDADTWRPINEYISPGDPLDFEDENCISIVSMNRKRGRGLWMRFKRELPL
jgi:hypothetical protein